jgi:hypothetical protein
MHYKYASSEAPAPRRLWYKEFTPELQQTATLVADDVPLGEAAEAVDELQQKYNCTLIFKASSNERPPVDVQVPCRVHNVRNTSLLQNFSSKTILMHMLTVLKTAVDT